MANDRVQRGEFTKAVEAAGSTTDAPAPVAPPKPATFQIGSTRREVIVAQGRPIGSDPDSNAIVVASIEQDYHVDPTRVRVLFYGEYTWVALVDGRVVKWNDPNMRFHITTR